MAACGLTSETTPQIRETSFFTSHEALLLNYEEALARVDSTTGDWYDTSAHLLWIGERTRQLGRRARRIPARRRQPDRRQDSGPASPATSCIRLIDILNPANEAGRLTLIVRMGRGKVGDLLPAADPPASAAKAGEWSGCPTRCTPTPCRAPAATRPGTSTASSQEVRSFFAVHESEGTYAGGVHFEMTGQDVTECVGGAQAITEASLGVRYNTHCDPAPECQPGSGIGVSAGGDPQGGPQP